MQNLNLTFSKDFTFGKTSQKIEQNHLDKIREYFKTQLQEQKEQLKTDKENRADLTFSARMATPLERKDIIEDTHQAHRQIWAREELIENIPKIAENPYFARMDYEFEASEALENAKTPSNNQHTCYITKQKYAEVYPLGTNLHYVNWRAEIANLYYQSIGKPGKYPYRKQEANIALNIRIKTDEKEVLISDKADKQDDILQAKLAANSTGTMREVVETIQPEQNDAIRHNPENNLIIQGSAGSGKTIVGLHRLAYLMYAKNLNSSQVLFVSPNRNFSSYIENVLPELGEQKIPIYTLKEILENHANSLNSTNTKHIVADEAQDYTPEQIKKLQNIFPQATFTVLGDENQNLNPETQHQKLKNLLEKADYVEIKRAYRSSPEIITYTNQIIGANIEAIRVSNGISVTEYNLPDLEDFDNDFLSELLHSFYSRGLQNIAIVVRDSEIRRELRQNLKLTENIHLYSIFDAKGLEFDAAIVLDDYDEEENKLLYTACTRAQHALDVVKLLG